MRLIGRLILIPIGIAIAAFCALLFLGIVGMTKPEIAQAIAETAFRTVDQLFRTAMQGEEAILRYAQNFVLFSRFVIVVLLLPVTLVAVIAEILAFRAWLFHALGVASADGLDALRGDAGADPGFPLRLPGDRPAGGRRRARRHDLLDAGRPLGRLRSAEHRGPRHGEGAEGAAG